MTRANTQFVAKTNLLVEKMSENIDLIKDKGLDKEFINKLKAEINLAAVYNEESENMKAEARAKTIQLNKKMREVQTLVKDAKKIIKRDFDKSKWLSFGIPDLR